MANMSKDRVNQIAKYLKDTYNPDDKTSRGHTKYVSATLKEAENLELNFKPDKGLSVKIAGVRVPVADLNAEDLATITEYLPNLQKVASAVGSKKSVSSATTI